ncbi:MAG: hypothetical protein FWC50_01115, partial [Planctomycetaceae bacterium]|nr:hypothetical protein [Planctomycetaceae bacterium]
MSIDHKPADPNRSLRWQIYSLMIMVAAGLCLGRIIAVDNVKDRSIQELRYSQIGKTLEEKRKQLEAQGVSPVRIEQELEKTEAKLWRDWRTERPMLSANDRSRFCTIRVLVEPELRETRTVERNGVTVEEVVPYAIDKITTKKGWDTIDKVCHTLPDDPDGIKYLYSSKPPLLPTVMAIPYWVIYNTTGRTFDTDPFPITRIMLVICHLIPLVIGWLLMASLIDRFGKTDWGRLFAVALTCFATFLSTFVVTLNNHLPAVFCIIVALHAAVKIWFDGDLRLRWFAAAAFFSAFAFTCDLPSGLFFGLLGLVLLVRFPRQTLVAGVPAAVVVLAAFFATNFIAHQTLMPPYSQTEWYKYKYDKYGKKETSYWSNPVGPDQGEADARVYAFHSTFGHHGFFSLTPVWLLGIAGLLLMLFQRQETQFRQYALLTIVMSLVCFLFYVVLLTPENRNYGGMTSGPRWAFWLIPFWTLALLPALDR